MHQNAEMFRTPYSLIHVPINLSYFWDPLGAVMTSAPPAVLQRKSVNIPTHFILLSFWKWEAEGWLCLLESPRQSVNTIPGPGEGRVSSGFPLEVCFLCKILVPNSSSLPDGEAHGR